MSRLKNISCASPKKVQGSLVLYHYDMVGRWGLKHAAYTGTSSLPITWVTTLCFIRTLFDEEKFSLQCKFIPQHGKIMCTFPQRMIDSGSGENWHYMLLSTWSISITLSAKLDHSNSMLSFLFCILIYPVIFPFSSLWEQHGTSLFVGFSLDM